MLWGKYELAFLDSLKESDQDLQRSSFSSQSSNQSTRMTVSSDILLWGLGGSALSMATSALMNDRLNHLFAELDNRAVEVHWPFRQLLVQHVSSWQFFFLFFVLVNSNTPTSQKLL